MLFMALAFAGNVIIIFILAFTFYTMCTLCVYGVYNNSK